MRRHRPTMPAGCQAAGDVKSAAQNFKTSHKLPHPLCAAPPPFTTPPPSLPLSCSCFASWPFLSLHCAKIKIYEGCKKQQRQRGGSERKARGRGGYGACCQGHSNVGERAEGPAMNAPKNLTPKWLQMSRAQRTKLCYTLYIVPLSTPHPPPPTPCSTGTPPLHSAPSRLEQLRCLLEIVSLQIKSTDVTSSQQFALYCQKFLRKDEKREAEERDEEEGGGEEKRESLSECNEWMNVFSLRPHTHTHTAIKQKTLWSRSYYVWIHFNWAEERS